MPFPFEASWEHTVGPYTNEIIHLQIGGCGNSTACKLWDLMKQEHSIDSYGLCQGNECQRQKIHVYYNEAPSNCFTPRAILVDLEPSNLDSIRASPIGASFNPSNYIYGKKDNHFGQVYAVGYYDEGAEVMDALCDAVRREAESCDNMQGFHVSHSLGGGTGSGLGALALEKLIEEYPNKMTNTFSVFSKVSDVHVEPYNIVLALSQLIENSVGTYCLDNEATYNIVKNILKKEKPAYADLNHQMVSTLSDVTAPYRLPVEGQVNGNMRKLAVNMTPYPRLHFYMLGHAPITNSGSIQMQPSSSSELTKGIFHAQNMLTDCDPCCGKTMTGMATYRGAILLGEIEKQMISLENPIECCDWLPDGMKVGVCDVPAHGYKSSATSTMNNSAIQGLYQRVLTQFNALIRRKAFTYNYLSHGMDEMEFIEAESNVNDLISEYQQYQDGAIEEEGGWDSEESEDEEGEDSDASSLGWLRVLCQIVKQ